MSNSTTLPRGSSIKTIGIKKFAPMPIELIQNHEVSIGAKMVYAELLSFAWFNNEVFPGQKRMMYELGIKKVDTLRKYLEELRNLEVLSWKQEDFQSTNTYTLKALPKSVKKKHKTYINLVHNEKAPWMLEKKEKSLEKATRKTGKVVTQKRGNNIDEGKVDERCIDCRRDGRLTFSPTFLSLGEKVPTSTAQSNGIETTVLTKRLFTNPMIEYFFQAYRQSLNKEHPELTESQTLHTEAVFSEYEVDRDVIDEYFNTTFGKKTNYMIYHFSHPGIVGKICHQVRD